jgi:mono/diheme cytochrome c family protein
MKTMGFRAPVLILLGAACQTLTPAVAQQPTLDATQQLGKRLFEQSCGVCHTPPTLVSGVYGPRLSKESAGGRAETVREVITNGTPRMPGFKYTYSPDQIAAIAAYLQTVPPTEQPAPPAGAERVRVQDN